ncbi:hypothetical protein [Butyrivibrio sp. INlla14]|uniref:hypothetical protein n=1 Tax=Butyrivibrio sp. INlla14 TaxID=1520808 RepID=UPI0008764D26|nr:hypothetical protein [Butyrivibrio sp. INlla14]SCY52767.1 hypothetical protein SAMN02910371_02644 [Butyrivibrio sp. INlla14]
MRKRIIWLQFIVLLAFATSGCGDSSEISEGSALSTEIFEPVDQSSFEGMEVQPVEDASKDSGVDVDLTALSSTMVYAEVYNMMVSPDNYKGKTVKMAGQFVPYYDESTGNYYFACFISDATACCSQGIEFILAGDYSYPDDYPSEGETICVIGTFDTYMEGDSMYCTLRDASFA